MSNSDYREILLGHLNIYHNISFTEKTIRLLQILKKTFVSVSSKFESYAYLAKIESGILPINVGTNNSISMGYAVVSINNAVTFGNNTTDSRIAFGATSITAPSDQRLKEDIQDGEAKVRKK